MELVQVKMSEIRGALPDVRNPIPNLANMGYGLFEPLPNSDKPTMFAMALSQWPCAGADEYVKLIDKFEPELMYLARSIMTHGMQTPITVVRVNGGYRVAFGKRRLLAYLYKLRKMDTPQLANYSLTCLLRGNQGDSEANAESLHHLGLSPMDEARIFGRYREAGHSVQSIADLTDTDPQVVRYRLQLLKLPDEIQAGVHRGELSPLAALKWLKDQKEGSSARQLNKAALRGLNKDEEPSDFTEAEKLLLHKACTSAVQFWITAGQGQQANEYAALADKLSPKKTNVCIIVGADNNDLVFHVVCPEKGTCSEQCRVFGKANCSLNEEYEFFAEAAARWLGIPKEEIRLVVSRLTGEV